MDIWHISDLHLEKEEVDGGVTFGPIPKADMAAVLGDLSSDMMANLRWVAKVVRPHMPVVYVPGNHDFHFRGIEQASAEGRAYARRLDIHFLEADVEIVSGVRFVGGTFWSDYRIDMTGKGLPESDVVKMNMDNAIGKSDYTRILKCERTGEKLRPWHTAAIHDRTKLMIGDTLSRPCDGPTVVLTHHGALADVWQPGFETSDTHPSYTSDQTGMMLEHSPDMWLFGHIHQSFRRKVGKTTVACNPRGYGHETTGFDWSMVHTL